MSNEAIFQNEIAAAAKEGWKVESIHGYHAVLTRPKRIGWFWNTILVIITGGLWLIPVIYWALNRKQRTLLINVDSSGKVTRR